MHKIFFTKDAREDLKSLDRVSAQRVIKKLYFYVQQKDPLIFAKKLRGEILGNYRFRIGDYRVLFDVDIKGNILILLILRVKHRKDVYRL